MSLLNEWIDKADADYRGAVSLHRPRKEPLPDLVCYHCQQSIEKYLKAYLVWHNIAPPRIHNLEDLLKQCATQDTTFLQHLSDVQILNQYGITIRYPGFAASVTDADEAVKLLRRLRRVLRKKLGL